MEACWAHNPEVRGSKPRSAKYFGRSSSLYAPRSLGVVVITSALHAEGHEFDPRRNLSSFIISHIHIFSFFVIFML